MKEKFEPTIYVDVKTGKMTINPKIMKIGFPYKVNYLGETLIIVKQNDKIVDIFRIMEKGEVEG